MIQIGLNKAHSLYGVLCLSFWGFCLLVDSLLFILTF